jgi:hypothetical protein
MLRIAEGTEPTVMSSMVPIYRDTHDSFDLDRTGVLFRIGSERFVITAAHGIAEYQKKGTWLYVDSSHRTHVPIPLVRSMFYWTEVDDNRPDRDIAVIHLDHESADEFYPQRRFLTLADCDRLIDPKPGVYMVTGIPWDTYQITTVAKGMALSFMGFVEPNPEMANFHPQIHLALALDGYGVQLRDADIVPAAIPEFDGMSGCGIWRVASTAAMQDPDSWNPSMVRLVAIQNRTQLDAHTVGTWFKHVLDLITSELPHLKPATEIQHTVGY